MGCCGRKKFPTKVKQVKSAAMTLANVLAHAKNTGEVKADEKTIAKRVDLCKSCRHLSGSRCTVCGCFTSLKIPLKVERCPLKKW